MTTPPGELMYMKIGLSTDCASRYSSCVRRAHRGTGERRGELCGAEAGPRCGLHLRHHHRGHIVMHLRRGDGWVSCHRGRGGGASRRGLTGPLTQMIRSCSSREKMSKARSPRAVVSSTIGMRLLRGASWEGGWKLGEWKLRLSAEAAVADDAASRATRIVKARCLGTWVHERNNGVAAVPNHLILSRARAPQRAELPCIMLRHTSVDGCHIVGQGQGLVTHFFFNSCASRQ